MITNEQIIEYLTNKFNVYLQDSNPYPQYRVEICDLSDEFANEYEVGEADGLKIYARWGKCKEKPKGTYEVHVLCALPKSILRGNYFEVLNELEKRTVRPMLTMIRSKIRKVEYSKYDVT